MKCNKCKRNDLIESDFCFKNKSKGIRHSVCKCCQRKYKLDYYYKNKQKSKDKVMERKAELIKWLHNLKTNLKCEECSESHVATLQFHHVDPDKKTFTICQLIHDGYSKERILEEMQKCQVLCANCHSKKHYIGV